MNRFYSAKWENIFHYILTIQLIMKQQKCFWQWYISWYTMAVTMATYKEDWNVAFKASKPLWER